MLTQILLYIMAAFYIFAGISHFRNPRFFLKMMPPWLPFHQFLVDLSGIIEILLGVGLIFPQTRELSAYGIIILLIAVFPVNVFMLTSGKFKKIPQWFLVLRLPLQGLLMYWAYIFTS